MFFHFTAAASLHGGVTAEPLLSRSALGHLFHVSHIPVHLPQWDQPVWDSLWLLPEPCRVGVTRTVAESDRLIDWWHYCEAETAPPSGGGSRAVTPEPSACCDPQGRAQRVCVCPASLAVAGMKEFREAINTKV